MRLSLCLGGLLLCGLALAQTSPVAPNADKLDAVLANWEKAMSEIHSMIAVCSRVTVDKVFQSTEVFEGTAKFVKSQKPGQGSRALLELHKKDQAGVYEKFICAGNMLYEYAPQNKVIRVHELPPSRDGKLADDNFLSFLFGMRASEAKQRYKLTYVPGKDTWYHYIRIEPNMPADRADFTEARLVLFQRDSMPAQLWFQQPNGNEVTWSFPKMIRNTNVDPQEFEVTRLPAADWRIQQMPKQPGARVIRQSQ